MKTEELCASEDMICEALANEETVRTIVTLPDIKAGDMTAINEALRGFEQELTDIKGVKLIHKFRVTPQLVVEVTLTGYQTMRTRYPDVAIHLDESHQTE